MNETRRIEWTTGSGNEIVVTMTAQYDLGQQGRRKTAGQIVIDIDTTVDGVSLGGMAKLETIDHPQVAAKIGNGTKAVGLTQERYDDYTAALSELTEYADNGAAEHASNLDAITEGSVAIERKMAYGE